MSSAAVSSSRAMRPMAFPKAPPALLDGMDYASSTLVLRLQLEDINQLLGSPTSELSGWEQTLLSQKQEIERILVADSDRQMSLSMTRAALRMYISSLHKQYTQGCHMTPLRASILS